MTRSLLTLLLLLHYLLVACASVSARPEPLSAQPLSYTHSPDCQLANAWRGGQCFEDCNGVQYVVHKNHKAQSLPQLLAAAKGIDLHCLPATAIEPVGSRPISPANRLRPGRTDAVLAGVRGCVYAPPRRG